MIRYRECQRNHAAHLGSHVVDGCGEFMPSGEEGTHLALKCAACNCHRNFHRRELEATNSTAAPLLQLPVPASAPHNTSTTNCYISFSKYHKNHLPIITPNHHHNNNTINDNTFAATTPAPAAAPHGRRATPVMMAFGGGAAESSSDDLNGYRGQFVEQYGVSKKRFRTKFTQEQKDKMMEFAEKLGWKIQKQDDVEVLRFCHDVGVKRQVFKVWMHNNKQASKKKQES
ncbi:Zinc-finger homeodomain protein 6 [Bienertia sinuspersici]